MGIRITIEDTGAAPAITVSDAVASAVDANISPADLDGGAPSSDLLAALAGAAGEETQDGAADLMAGDLMAGDLMADPQVEPEPDARAGSETGGAAIDAGGPDMTVGDLIESLGGSDDPDSDPPS